MADFQPVRNRVEVENLDAFPGRQNNMATDLIRYDVLVQQALRGVVRKVLVDGARDGLPGNHHFYISFDTHAAGVKMSPRLREMYPEEMTVVLQHQFWDLAVTETGFEVSLSFDKIAERLGIPFDAITGFFDPSVKFGLKFEAVQAEETQASASEAKAPRTKRPAKPRVATDGEPATIGKKTSTTPEAAPAADAPAATGETADPAPGTAEVVSLDAFRKKK